MNAPLVNSKSDSLEFVVAMVMSSRRGRISFSWPLKIQEKPESSQKLTQAFSEQS